LKIKTIIIWGFLFLLLSSIFPITTSINLDSQDLITVDDDGGADYTRIQDAIDNASDGDTVFVCNGVYYENLYIDKMINLFGEDKNLTIIDGNRSNDVIYVNYSHVRINHFTIRNSGNKDLPEMDSGIQLDTVNYCSMFDNILINNNNGIYIYNSSFNMISDNINKNNDNAFSVDGFYDYNLNIIFESSFNYFCNNTITDNRNGISFGYTKNSTICNNIISNNLNSGIYLFNSKHHIIINNTIMNCSNGIYIEESSNNIVQNNHLTENEKGVFCSYAPENNFRYNNFILNKDNAKFTKFFHQGFLIPNKWNNNYWDDWIGLGDKIIPGIMYIPNDNLIGLFVPWIEVDWRPVREPYDISFQRA